MDYIRNLKPGQHNINAVFIVLEIGTSFITKNNQRIRNFKVADQTGCINMGLWTNIGDGIVPGDILKLTKGYALIWRHRLTLYSSKESEIYKIGEFCMLFNEHLNMSEPHRFKNLCNIHAHTMDIE